MFIGLCYKQPHHTSSFRQKTFTVHLLENVSTVVVIGIEFHNFLLGTKIEQENFSPTSLALVSYFLLLVMFVSDEP